MRRVICNKPFAPNNKHTPVSECRGSIHGVQQAGVRPLEGTTDQTRGWNQQKRRFLIPLSKAEVKSLDF